MQHVTRKWINKNICYGICLLPNQINLELKTNNKQKTKIFENQTT